MGIMGMDRFTTWLADAIKSFERDAADTKYQSGYLAALKAVRLFADTIGGVVDNVRETPNAGKIPPADVKRVMFCAHDDNQTALVFSAAEFGNGWRIENQHGLTLSVDSLAEGIYTLAKITGKKSDELTVIEQPY